MALIASTGGFIPTPESLNDACEMLTISRNPMDPRYTEAAQNLERLMVQAEFVIHLTYIFARLSPQHLPDDVRMLAGLVLKQGVTLAPLKALPTDVQQFVKCELLVALSDPHSEMVRKTAGSVITTLASKARIAGGLAAWPTLLPSLFELLDPAAVTTREGMFGATGALSCLAKLCEDFGWCMDEVTVNALFPRLVPFFDCSDTNCRLSAVIAMQHIVSGVFSQSTQVFNISGHLEAYLAGLSKLTGDPEPTIRKVVCQCLIALFDTSPQALLPVLPSVIEFMLHASQDPDHEVAIAAIDFWIPCCTCNLLGPGSNEEETVVGALPRLIPILLQGMCYSSEEISEFESENSEDAGQPDRPEDLRPIFRKMGSGKGSTKKKRALSTSHTNEDDDDDDDDDEDDNDEVVEMYTLRKKSAASLDKVSERFGAPMMPLVLPLLVDRLGSDSVWVREAAILAFGALQTGSSDAVEEHLPQLFPFLMEHLEDPNAQMREVCCWTIGRYLSWVVNQAWVGPQGEEVLHVATLHQLTKVLLDRVIDGNKKVQQFACSTFAIFIETCSDFGCSEAFAPPHTSQILQCLFSALPKYQTKSTVIMMDTIGTFCDVMAVHFPSDPELSATLLNPLMDFWQQIPDTDNLVFPLFECLSAAAAATQLNFQTYALAVLVRSCAMIENVLLLDAAGALNAQGDPANKQVAASALDLIDGVARGLEQNFILLLQSAPDNGEQLLRVLGACLGDEEDDVRQAALGLLGDLAKYSPNVLSEIKASVLPMVVDSISLSRGRKVCSNAVWCLGELAMAFGDDLIGPMVVVVIPMLGALALNDDCHPNLLENIATSIGRIASTSAPRVSPFIEVFIDNWLLALQEVGGSERDQSFQGLVSLAQVAWEPVVTARYPEFLRAVASWVYFDPPAPELRMAFQQIINQACSQMASVDSREYLDLMEESYREYLVEAYSF